VKRNVVVLAVCILAVASAADPLAAAASQRSRAEVYTLEGLGALPGVAGCGCLGLGFAFVGAMAAWGIDDPGQNPGGALVGFSLALVSAAALPAAAGFGTAWAGRELGEDGSTGWAIGGAYAGLPLAVGAIALGVYVGNSGQYGHSHLDIPIYVLAGLTIPVGAVVGYNLSIERQAGPYQPGLGNRLELPGVALTSVRLPDHSVEYGVKVQLAGLRF